MKIKNNDQCLKVVHDLEDKYSFLDDKGNVNRSALNIPEDDKKLQAVRKYITQTKSYVIKHIYHFYNKKGTLLVTADNKADLVRDIKSKLGLTKDELSYYKVMLAIHNRNGKLKWGYITVDDESVEEK